MSRTIALANGFNLLIGDHPRSKEPRSVIVIMKNGWTIDVIIEGPDRVKMELSNNDAGLFPFGDEFLLPEIGKPASKPVRPTDQEQLMRR